MKYLKQIYKLKDPAGYKLLLAELENVAKATQDQHPEEGEAGDFGEAQEHKMPGMCTIMFDPYFRMATYVVFGLCVGNTLTGINAINEFTARIFEDIQKDNPGHGLKPVVGTALCGGIQWFACFVAPFLTYFNLRTIIIGGFLVMGLFEVLLGFFAMYHINLAVLACLMISLFVY